MRASLKKISIFLSVIALIGALLSVAIPRTTFAEAGGDASGGSDGCGGFDHNTCFGAVWRYFKTTSNSVGIPNVGGGQTIVSNCGNTGGYFAYVLPSRSSPTDLYNIRAWEIGPVDGIAGNASEFFGGWTNYYGYKGTSGQAPPVNPSEGDYSWAAAESAFAQTKALGQNSGYEWNGGSHLGWFCYKGLDFNLTPTITGTPAFSTGNSTGADKATLYPVVNNTGSTESSNNITYRIVTFQIPPGGGAYPGAATNGTAPEQYYKNGAIAVANVGGQKYQKNVTAITVDPQKIGDYPIGTKLCYALSVTPVTQTNSNWRHSTPFCVIIAKSPKIQVHGGDIRVGSYYVDQTAGTGSNIVTSQTVKKR